MLYRENKRCLVCNDQHLINYLDLTDQPLANSFHKGKELEKYPLQMRLCMQCWHSQLSISVDPEIMFEHYLYISDTSHTLTSYFEKTTEYILSKIDKPKNVLEIACNSGLLLEMFRKKGIEVLGVDPAKNIRELSRARGLDVYVDYWNNRTATKINTEKGKYDLILAFHVLPHVQDPNEFIESCSRVLSPNGSIFIQTSQCDMLKNNEFDVIYHEHSSYFTANSILKLARNHNMYISSMKKTEIHGKSFLFSFTRIRCDESEVHNLIEHEAYDGAHRVTTYENFANKAKLTRTSLTQNLTALRSRGFSLIGYGAAAKGNTLLNYLKLKLDCIIDDNPLKWGYLTPGMNIPIRAIDYLTEPIDRICFIPLAWNFYDEIRERVKVVRNNPNDIFVRYFPEYVEL